MKFLRFLIIAVTAGFMFSSCQKEFSSEAGNAKGSLKADAGGDCFPIIIHGNFKKDSIIKDTNYAQIQVNITQTGTYFIKTDTVNGYSFSAAGFAAATGTNTIRLLASGKPIIPGVDLFTVKFDTSQCEFNVTVTGSGGGGGGGSAAVFTLTGTPTTCTGATQTTNFFATIPTAPANTVTVNADVTVAGTYTITASTTPANGLTFTGTGTLAVGNNQPITLVADGGAPSTAGSIPYTLTTTSPVSNCGFNLNVQPAPPAATYTINCSGATTTGTYQAGTATTSANKVTISAISTGMGSYNITTNLINGVSFSGGGVFPGAGPQSPQLTATGTPIAAGTFNYTATAATGGSTCTFSVTFSAAAPPASYTINCTGATMTGTYQAGTATNSTNTVTISATSTGMGSYSVTTNSMNGVSFSSVTGTFPGAGTQPIILTASGIPAAAGTFMYTATATGGSTCTFSVTYTAGPPPPPAQFITAMVGGVAKTFSTNITASFANGSSPAILLISGSNAAGDEFMDLEIDNPGTSIPAGSYNVNSMTYFVDGTYTDPGGVTFVAQSGSANPSPSFQITLNGPITMTPTTATGSFSGAVNDAFGNVIQITNGLFSVNL